MTENKRFTYRYNVCFEFSEFEIIDLKNDEYYSMIETNEAVVITLVKCLNGLSDENEELKNKYVDEYSLRETLQEDLQRVEEENEQLKTQLQNTSDQRDEFHRGARENANRVGKLEKENEQLKSENQQIRDTIKEMYETERTALGRSVLRQLLEKIE